MANKNAPMGLRAVKHLDGSAYNGQANLYHVPSSNATGVFVGDLVKLTGASDTVGVPDITPAAVADVFVGVVVGVRPNPDALQRKYLPALTEGYVLVSDAPDTIYEIQDSGTSAATDVGLNAQITLAVTGSTVTGVSGTQLDGATKAGTATHGLKIVRYVQRPDNEIGANGKFEVLINRHQYVNQLAGV